MPVALVLAAWMAVFLLEKEKWKKAFVLTASLFLFVAFRGENLLPSVILFGYALVLCMRHVRGTSKVTVAAFSFGILLLLAMNGSLLREYQKIGVAENFYGMQREDKEVLDLLLSDETASVAIVPKQLAPYIGIYTSKIRSFCEYPEKEQEDVGTKEAGVAREMLSSHPDMKYITSAARQEGCTYIVLDSQYHYPETPPEAYDFDPVGTAGEYVVYKDMQK